MLGGAALLAVALLVLAVRVWPLASDQNAPVSTPGAATTALSKRFALSEPSPLPELRFEDAEGRSLSLADFRGKIVLLNVWATWCVPCRKEMPTLDRLQAMLGSPDFQVVALSIDRGGLKPVRDFYAEIGLKHLAMYVDASGQSNAALGLAGIPTTLLVDRDGREIGRFIGPAEWDAPDMVTVIRQAIERPAIETGAPSPSRGNGRKTSG
jgi:thiol-disulfide isomerase/thioredoxin